MEANFLISKELDRLLFLEIINDDLREQSNILSMLISSIKETSPLVEIYEEKKQILLELFKVTNIKQQELYDSKREIDKLLFTYN